MKRALALCLVLGLLCGCGGEKTEQDMIRDALEDIAPARIAAYIVKQGCGMDPAELERLDESLDEQGLNAYLTEVYGLSDGSWTDCAIYRAGGSQALEIAVIRTKNAKKAQAAAQSLTEYIARREGDFAGYEPEQADIVHGSLAVSSEYGDAALLICPDAEAAQRAFQGSYTWLFRYPFDPPGEDDMTLYDTSAILTAWDSGDTGALSEQDRAMLEAAAQVLEQTTGPDMSPYEREKAVYAWITANVKYDRDHYDKTVTLDPASSNPYGPLHNGKGICVGVASAFQLLMDMSGVECITVVGASRENAQDHAWNMVRLNGQWYCVDPTWDIGSSEETWDYFNVTSEVMTGTSHQWDYENVPVATAEDGGVG